MILILVQGIRFSSGQQIVLTLKLCSIRHWLCASHPPGYIPLKAIRHPMPVSCTTEGVWLRKIIGLILSVSPDMDVQITSILILMQDMELTQ